MVIILGAIWYQVEWNNIWRLYHQGNGIKTIRYHRWTDIYHIDIKFILDSVGHQKGGLYLRNLSLCLFFWNRIVPSTRAFMGHFVAMLAMLRMQDFLLNLWAPTFTKIWRYQTHVLQLQGGRRNIIGKIYEILMVNVWVCEYMHLDVGPWKMKNNLLWIIHFGGGSVQVFGVVGKKQK